MTKASPTAANSGQHHWHGFTQMATHEPLVIREADGCWLTTEDGKRLFDGVSSLWCNVHGHRHPVMDQAVRDQLDRVAHVTSLGMSCDTTEKLATKLAEITPGDLSHVFFSSDGSSAVEASLKMAIQYWHGRGDAKPEKTEYLALGSAYHGDTTGSVALGGIAHFHKLFAPILFQPRRGPTPCTYRLPDGIDRQHAADHYADRMEEIIREHHQKLAAVVMEPLVQGAAGMVTHPDGFLRRVRELCDRYEVLLICDEVATGFGRTGKMFACEHEGVTPDILCVGKGLTGGYLPMAATIARPHVYEAFLAPPTELKQFFHGHTFGGNPLAAAAAIASIDLFEKNRLCDSVQSKSNFLRGRLDAIAGHPHVGDIRGRGLMVGIELVQDRAARQPFDAAKLIGQRVCKHAIDNGVWVRPLGDVIVLMPPLVASEDELNRLAETVIEAIGSVVAAEESSDTAEPVACSN